MKYRKTILEQKHVEQVLRHDLLIGSDSARDGKRKQFLFNPWRNEYRIAHGREQVDSGQALEELLDAYNAL